MSLKKNLNASKPSNQLKRLLMGTLTLGTKYLHGWCDVETDSDCKHTHTHIDVDPSHGGEIPVR